MFAKFPQRATTDLPYSVPTSAGFHRSTWSGRGTAQGLTVVAATTAGGGTPCRPTLCYWMLASYGRGLARLALRSARWIFLPLFLFSALILTSRGLYNQGRTAQFMPETHYQDLLPLTGTPTPSSYIHRNRSQASTAASRFAKGEKMVATFHSTASIDTTRRRHNVTTQATKVELFGEKYRPHYAQNDSDFFSQVRRIAKKTWQPNVNNSQEFRNHIRHELGLAGSVQNFLLTKNNTHKGQSMKFYMTRISQRVSTVLLKYLPKVSPFKPKQYGSCSVVGSSGLLRGSRCGNEIDNSEFVFRFNMAQVKGFEDDVGRKINLTTLNPSFVRTKVGSLNDKFNRTLFANMLKQFRGSYLWLPAYAVSGNLQIVQRTTDFAEKSKLVKAIHGHPDHFLAVSNVWRKITGIQGTWPTTGLYVILSIMDICERISVYGFWPFQTGLDGRNVTYHYHDEIVGKKAVHSFSAEFRQLAYLHELGVIRMVFHPCEDK